MLILASKSPRRKEILEMINIDFKVALLDVSEDVIEDDPKKYVLKTAYKKGEAASQKYNNDTVLSCDTIVVLEDEILEKPKYRQDAYNMIKKIFVYTGVFIGNKKENFEESFFVSTKVIVDELTEDEINEYINTQEPYDKAGGYAIQGIFGKYIKGIEGDYFNVVGLPINEIYKKLKKLNFKL